ncbi:MAG: phage major capsid protein [Firmicutes bacterium]|nr:phage major capsid protein [Bacillota bacterium]
MVTLQSAENALKSVYLSAVTELLNTNVNPLLTKIEQTASDVWGKEIRKAVSYGINGGIGAGDEDSQLPQAHGNNYLQFVTSLKNLYGQIEITDKAIQASDGAKGSFVDLLNAELQGLLNASRFNLGRMLYGDGNGSLGSIRASTDGGATHEVGSPHMLIEGLVVDVVNASGVVIGAGNRIRHVDRDNNRISFERPYSGTTISIAGAVMHVQGSRGKEITGIGSLFNNDPLYGIDRATHPFLRPHSKNVNGQISEILMQETIDRLENTAGSTVDFIACSADVKYAYQEYMAQFKRNIDILELEGGFKTLSYNGIPLVFDRFIGNGTMFMLNTKAFKLHQLCDWRYLENENGRILRQMQGKPVYTATLVKYCDLICDKPNGQARLTGIRR